jgi:hypothetical protein
VRVTDRQHEISPLHLRPVANPLELQCLGEAVTYTGDHVRHERARQAVHRPVAHLLSRAPDDNLTVRLFDPHLRVQITAEFTFGALDSDVSAVNAHLNAPRQWYRHLTYLDMDLTRHSTALRRRRSGGALRPPVMTPSGVERMAMPRPPHTGYLALRRVDPQSGTAHALQAHDYRLPRGV